jgi:ribosomal protein S8
MEILCSRINNGYIGNIMEVFIPNKKKYLPVLEKLCELNYIGGFRIEDNRINIILRYYNGKPLIYLEPISTSGGKQYHSVKKLKNKNSIRFFFNSNLYSTDNGLFFRDEMLLLNKGGKGYLKIYFLYRNIIY